MAKRKIKKIKMKKKTKKYEGMRRLGESNILVGILLTLLGGVIVTLPESTTKIMSIGSIVVILGIILAGFGLSDYLGV